MGAVSVPMGDAEIDCFIAGLARVLDADTVKA
jgi:hypothetical protein